MSNGNMVSVTCLSSLEPTAGANADHCYLIGFIRCMIWKAFLISGLCLHWTRTRLMIRLALIFKRV